MAGLNSKYVLAPNFLWYFVDKDNGVPLTNGVIYFWEDSNRNNPKPVYQLTGTYPNYSYVSMGAELTLSSVGTIVNSAGQEVPPYFLPYLSDTSDTVDNYYIELYSEGGKDSGVLQMTVAAYPGLSTGGGIVGADEIANYVPNGQFWFHNIIPATDTTMINQINANITDIAQGGWTFERDSGSSTDFITWDYIDSFVSDPSRSPRYACRLQTTSIGSPSKKYVRLSFQDVNKFCNPADGSQVNYRFAMWGKVNSGGTIAIDVILVKHFGAGGSLDNTTTLQTFNFTTVYGVQQVAFDPGTNASFTIGDDNTDTFSIVLSFPINSYIDFSMTDVIFCQDTGVISSFPVTPNNEFDYQAVTGFQPIPVYDGSDFGLPLIKTAKGTDWDQSRVGSILWSMDDATETPDYTEYCNGQGFRATLSSSFGVPYSRLRNRTWVPSLLMCKGGTGSNYFSAYPTANTNELLVSVNSIGAAAAATDGTTATGFTFTSIAVGVTGRTSVAYKAKTNSFIIQNTAYGYYVYDAHTSGFTFLTINDGAASQFTFSAAVVGAASTLGSKYFTWTGTTGTGYTVYYKYNGTGTDPAVAGYTSIPVNVLTGWSTSDTAFATAAVVNGQTLTDIICTAASAITTGSFFNVTSNTEEWYVWYQKDGAGTDPAPAGKKGIKVSILTADTAAQVTTKTITAMNYNFVGLPDFRGRYVRGLDVDANDPDSVLRFSTNGIINGNVLGSYQFDQLSSHLHDVEIPVQELNVAAGGGGSILNQYALRQTLSTGLTRTEVRNIVMNAFMYT